MKYSELLRRSVTLRRLHSVSNAHYYPLCAEVRNRVGKPSCLGCPIDINETERLHFLPPLFGCR